MKKAFFRKSFLMLPVVLVVILPVLVAFYTSETVVSAQTTETSGSLMAVGPDGKPKAACPLKHTDVKAEISGFLSRVVVTQQFENEFNEAIEAVYIFPLPQNAAVDDMTMIVGDRTIRGKILPREEAQAVYEGAKSRGQIASLLDQERPNIFTQSVANILPGQQIKITISYVETLRYEDGAYEFVFPMVVGPRYIPIGISQPYPFPAGNNAPPAISRIVPKSAAPGERAGHDISLEVTLDAGLIVDSVESKTHPVDVDRRGNTRARIKLRDADTIPNKDFILRYDVAGRAIQDAVLTHRSDRGGFFTLILQPPERVTADDVTPKELVFVLDTSGSMSGLPIEKAKETMKLAIENLYPSDTFNVITFSGDTRILFDQPVRATRANRRRAQDFLSVTSGYGGTEMMTAIKAALESSDAQSHVRIVCFMTDGFVGNDMEIIGEIQKHQNARVFAFGVGSSVNRFLLDNMATAGRGEVEYVGLGDDGTAAAKRFHQRIRNPLLTDISIDWSGLPVTDIYPQRIPDLFGAKPVILTGRYSAPGSGTIKLKGNMAGSEFTREIQVTLPETMALHDVLAPLWARARIDSFMSQDYVGSQFGRMRPDLKETITQLGLEFRLMTQFTSFVAIEEMMVTDGGILRRIDVPVDVPDGMNINPQANAGYIVGGSPTGLLAPYNGQVLRRENYAFSAGANPRPIAGGVITKSGAAATRTAPSNNTPGVALDATITENALVPKLTEEQLLERVRGKVDPRVFAVLQSLRSKNSPLYNSGSFFRGGKAEVQVWFNDKSEAALLKIKELGFETLIDQPGSKFIIGRIPLDKLESLALLEFVRYVSPQLSR